MILLGRPFKPSPMYLRTTAARAHTHTRSSGGFLLVWYTMKRSSQLVTKCVYDGCFACSNARVNLVGSYLTRERERSDTGTAV